MPHPTVKDVMTQDVISVKPNTLIIDAHKLMAENNFDGLPVVDEENHLVGIITEYDFLSKGSTLHLPTFQKIFSAIKIYSKRRDRLRAEIEKLKRITVKDIMNLEPLTLGENAPFEKVVETFRDHHRVNPIPVIDKNNKVVGVVSRYDVLKLFDLLLEKHE